MLVIAQMPIRFDQPLWLVVLVLLVPAFLIARRSIGGLSPTKAYVAFALRSILIALLSIALAGPVWEKRGEGLTVTILLDRSQSIPLQLKRRAHEFLTSAAEADQRRDEDRVAVITIASDANIAATPDVYATVPDQFLDEGDTSATNLAEGLRRALAIRPNDTANRFVLASDGNETAESVLAAAELARANNIPIDVLPLEYEYPNEVIFEQIVAPARARQGQTVEAKLVLRTQTAATGTVRLAMNGQPLDLNGEAEGDALAVTLEPGPPNVLPVSVSLDESGTYQFDAVFRPDDPAMDAIDRNNTAVAVTFVAGFGSLLVLDDGSEQSQYLVGALREAGMTVDLRLPDAMIGGLVFLSAYDAVVLVNIPRWAFDEDQDRMVHAYVHDLGGGLVMIGGAQSFGAGGWIESEVAKALPVELNPPDIRQMPAGALALMMHSSEMPQGNFWGQKVAQAAIEALSRLDYAGIVEYDWGAGCRWAFPMQRLRDKAAALEATRKMVNGDMPDFGSAMELAFDGLIGVPAAQRHAIIISDGDASAPSDKLLKKYKDANITITTVMVGGHGTVLDRNKMKAVADRTGGTFYNVTNPKKLPQIFIKEAQFVSRSLIQEGDVYQPTVVMRLPGPIQGFDSVPAIDGYVLTAARAGLAQIPIVIPTTDANDPLFAHWNYGLGRSIAYTSDVSSLWGTRWASWARFRAFWEQAIRWVMRPSSPTNIHVNTHLEGDAAIVEVEALGPDASFLNFLRTNAIVIRPDVTDEPLALQQTGPGRYRGQFRTGDAGAYLVNIAYAAGSGDGVTQGTIQAAVTVPYPREFRTVKHNAALLHEVASLTGGRVLDAADPALVNLFDRGFLEVPKSPQRVWDLLAILAASLLVLDVATRRIAVSPRRVAELAGRAVGRRGEVSADAVAAWKRTRARVARQQETAAHAARQTRYQATEEDAAYAIDVGEEVPIERRQKPAKARRADPDAAPEPEEGEDADYTARLLAAKRRARGRAEPENEAHD